VSRVYLNLGSNVERDANLCAGLDALEAAHGPLQCSSVYESDAVGFDGAAFLNMAVELHTACSVAELHQQLRELEYAMGRPANASRFSSRTFDIDILTFDDCVGVVGGVELPRPEILENAFVLGPLAELAPGVMHPVAGSSYAELWEDYDQSRQRLRRVDFHWQGKQISLAK
jgi:2-amino-4-hydroxy-6-hydroxymethyldihydropteridine diphosphokinase